jgi:uncharacterized protein
MSGRWLDGGMVSLTLTTMPLSGDRVRTYATIENRPGIYFFSLDVPNVLAITATDGPIACPTFAQRSTSAALTEESATEARVDLAGIPVECAIEYRTTGPSRAAAAGSFEYWAVERHASLSR